jgi:diadenosine tetraphosphatase ApaH/serine/threonine PP2A family protein phosphatase
MSWQQAWGISFHKSLAPSPRPQHALHSPTSGKGHTRLIALFADIHANLQAFEACLADARGMCASRFVFLGDFVGYGGDPGAVLDIVQDMCAKGALAVKGNHDDMAADFDRLMNPSAASAANWTRAQLNGQQTAFLNNLPMTIDEDDRLYVHADASAPEKWRYVTDCDTARRSLEAHRARIIFCGHVHQPTIYNLGRDDSLTKFKPEEDCMVPLLTSRRWHIVVPSVGQPRDYKPMAGYALFNPDKSELTVRRVYYDVEAASNRILEAGLPQGLAMRLYAGQ